MAARNSSKQQVEQAPATPPRRVEIRVDGRVQFAQDCYDVSLSLADDILKLHAALHPTMVEVAKQAPERFDGSSGDPRDGEEVLTRVHTGSRAEAAAPTPKES